MKINYNDYQIYIVWRGIGSSYVKTCPLTTDKHPCDMKTWIKWEKLTLVS